MSQQHDTDTHPIALLWAIFFGIKYVHVGIVLLALLVSEDIESLKANFCSGKFGTVHCQR